MARREEWQEQIKLAALLDTWLDPACTFWTAIDPVAPSAMSGFLRRRRGVKPGVPDLLVIFCKRLELKSRQGRCSASQRTAREAILRSGAQWWVVFSAYSGMNALMRSGVRFRTRTRDDGTTERWRQPRLAPWEVPRAEPRPSAPEVAAQQRWRARQRVGGAAQRAAVARYEGAQTPDGPALAAARKTAS